MMIHTEIRFPYGTINTEIWRTEIDNAVWMYNFIPNTHTGLTPIKVCSRSIFEPDSDTLANFHFWVCPNYLIEPNFHKSGVKIPPPPQRSQQGVNVIF